MIRCDPEISKLYPLLWRTLMFQSCRLRKMAALSDSMPPPALRVPTDLLMKSSSLPQTPSNKSAYNTSSHSACRNQFIDGGKSSPDQEQETCRAVYTFHTFSFLCMGNNYKCSRTSPHVTPPNQNREHIACHPMTLPKIPT